MAGRSHYRCLRCNAALAGARNYGHHLQTCAEPVSLALIFEELGVSVGAEDECWEHGRPDGTATKFVPKITVVFQQPRMAHLVVAEIVHGPCPDGLMLNHWCDNRRCFNYGHLYYGTAQDNARDAWRNGRRTMAQAQLDAMAEGLRRSPKNKARMIEHNRKLAEKNRGDNHWTRKDPEALHRWKEAIKKGKQNAALRGGDAV